MARRSLSPQDFVEAGLAVVERGGATALTARSLADEIGADPSAVYRHFSGLDALGSAILDEVLGRLDLDDLGDGSPRARLDRLVDQVHAVFLAHPNVVALALSSATPLPAGERISRTGLALLEELGLSGSDLLACQQMLESTLIGVHIYDQAGSPDHHEIRRLRWRRMEHPTTDEFSRSTDDVATINEQAFRLTMTSLLDRCEALAAASAPR